MSADRTEATTALIEWEVLSLEDLRGNLSSHEILYYELLDEDCPPTTTSSSRRVSFKGIEPQFVITDLDPGLQYCVGVAAKTGAGRGDFSYSLIPCKQILCAKHNPFMCVYCVMCAFTLQGIATACLLWCCWKSHHAQTGL